MGGRITPKHTYAASVEQISKELGVAVLLEIN